MSEGTGDASGRATGVPPGALTALLKEVVAAPESREEESPSLPPGTVVGHFEIIRELGRGGFGVVYEARDRDLGRQVAVKVVRPGRITEEEGKLSREAEAIARLAHPNLITLYEVGHGDDGPYLVFELLRGKTLQERLDDGPMPVQEAVHVATEVARGLAHAHAEGVVHRDLKPANVFVTSKGQVKILDFGMAHAFGRRRLLGGTPAYMAPEQWVDDPEDERTDVFALGVMLHRMLTGEYPFPEGKGRWAAEAATVPRLEVPGAPALAELVEKMLDRAPKARPRDGAALLAALAPIEDWLRAQPADGAGPVHAKRRKATSGDLEIHLARRRLAALLVAVGLVGALPGVAWYLWKQSGERGQGKAAGAAAPSVAVLPFANMSADRDQEYFADGVAEEILNALAHVEGLRVIGRTSSFSFKGKNEELASITRKLAVGAVLEGSVRKEANRVRVTAQLLDAADGSHLWSESYDRELTSIFQVQEEIARAVVAALEVKLLPDRGSMTRAAQTSSQEAYDLVLRANHVAAALTQEGYLLAHSLYEKAAALDPSYAMPHAKIAWTLRATFFAETEAEAEGLRKRAIAEADRAVRLGPELDEAYSVRALLRVLWQHDWAGAEVDLTKALALTPNHPPSLRRLGLLRAELGHLDEGMALVERSTRLDPLRAETWVWLGNLQAAAGRMAEARASLSRSREVAPASPEPRAALAVLEILDGHPAAALALAPSLRDDDGLATTALAEHDLGHVERARQALHRLIARHGHKSAQAVAEVYAWWGDLDPAFEWLDRSLGQEFIGFKWDPLLRKIRGDPRYTALLRRLNLPVD